MRKTARGAIFACLLGAASAVAAILAVLVWWTLHVTNDGRKAACPPGNPHCQSPR